METNATRREGVKPSLLFWLGLDPAPADGGGPDGLRHG